MVAWAELLSELGQTQADWALDAGTERTLAPGEALLEHGKDVDALHLVLTGLLDVKAPGAGLIAKIGAGEMVGEISFVDHLPASASVVAADETRVLSIPKRRLLARFEQDGAFAAAFYRALALTAARRLRIQAEVAPSGGEESEVTMAVRAQLDEFKQGLLEADKLAVKKGGLPEEAAKQIAAQMGEFAVQFNAVIRELGEDSSAAQAIGAMVQREVLPFMVMARAAERMYSKPRGYAGDFFTIELIYRDEPGGTGRLGAALDRGFLDMPAGAAVRNRRGLLAREINKTLAAADGPAEILSLACGPAREVFDVFETLQDKSQLKANLLDLDSQALSFVSEVADKKGLSENLNILHHNLIYLALGRKKIDLPPQALIYSIGLIDYFKDSLVLKLINFIYDRLEPGGRVILGNFHPDNTTKALMDHVLNWRLIHRSEDEMNRLFEASKFGRPCTEILYEETRINLFAVCVKAGRTT